MAVYFVVGWITCGIFGYSLIKGHIRREIELGFSKQHNKLSELACWFVGVIGPIGLIAALICSIFLSSVDEFGLRPCFKMPRELTDKAEKK